MYWIVTHYWISSIIAVVLIGGIMVLINGIKPKSTTIHPAPKRKTIATDLTKNPKSPLLIRLPKLG